MRFRNPFFLMGVIALGLIGLVLFGCSDDEKPTTPQDTTISAQELLDMASVQVDEQLDSIVVRLKTGLVAATVTTVREDDDRLFGPNPPDSSIVNDGWFVRWVTDLQAGMGTSLIDSIRYLRNGQVRPNAVGATTVTFHHYFSRTNGDTTASYQDIAVESHLTLEDVHTETATIDGTIQLQIYSKTVSAESTVRHSWSIQATAVAVRVDKSGGWSTGCPGTGICEMTVGHSYQVNSETPIESTWEFNVMFIDGNAFVNGTNNEGVSSSHEYQACTM